MQVHGTFNGVFWVIQGPQLVQQQLLRAHVTADGAVGLQHAYEQETARWAMEGMECIHRLGPIFCDVPALIQSGAEACVGIYHQQLVSIICLPCCQFCV